MGIKNKIKKILGMSKTIHPTSIDGGPGNTPEDRIRIAKSDLREARLRLKTAKIRLRNKRVEKKLMSVK